MKNRNARWWITFVVFPGLMLGAIVAMPAAYSSRLPETVARHWDLSGVANGSSPLWVIVALSAGMAALSWFALIAADRRGTSSRAMVSVVYFLEAIFVATMAMTVWANLDVSSWDQALRVGLPQVILVLAFAFAMGVVGWYLAEPDSYGETTPLAVPAATVGLQPGDSGVWLGKAESKFMPLLGVGLVIGAFVAGGFVAFLLILVAVLIFFMSAARVAVNPKGVSIGMGWWGWPRKFVPMDDISGAELLDIEPLSYGGWGIRGSGKGDSRTWGLIVRRGPGIRLVRSGQADVIVTVDDAQKGAGLINDLLRQSGRLNVG